VPENKDEFVFIGMLFMGHPVGNLLQLKACTLQRSKQREQRGTSLLKEVNPRITEAVLVCVNLRETTGRVCMLEWIAYCVVVKALCYKPEGRWFETR
jgi:hypothetical protein